MRSRSGYDDGGLTISVEEAAQAVTVHVAGEIDPRTAPQVEAALRDVDPPAGVDRVVLDGSRIAFIDSSGLRAMLAARESLAGRGLHLALRSPSDGLRRLLTITDLAGHFAIED